MSYIRTSGTPVTPTLQSAVLNQAAPVINTWYTIADLRNVEVLAMQSQVLVADETLQIRVTIDGVARTAADLAVVFANYYAQRLQVSPTTTVLTNSAAWANDNFFSSYIGIKCRTFLAEIRKTTANGAGNLQSLVVYQQN